MIVATIAVPAVMLAARPAFMLAVVPAIAIAITTMVPGVAIAIPAAVPAIAIAITIMVPGVAIAIPAAVPTIAIAIPAVVPSITVTAPTIAATRAIAVGTLVVVALVIDVAAFAVQHAIEMLAFLGRDPAVGARPGLVALDALLALLQATRFATRQLAVSSSLFDALLLVGFPRIDAPHRLRGRAARSE
jgi:hypothetical protein